jgi:hypothetical protein
MHPPEARRPRAPRPVLPILRRLPRERRWRRRLALGDLVRCHCLGQGRLAPVLGVVDISPSGLAVLLPQPACPGEELAVVLGNRLGLFAHRAAVLVTRCAEAPGQGFLVGGAFAQPLAPEVWRMLLS